MWMYATVRQVNGNGVVTNGEPGLVGAQCDKTNNYENCGTLGADGTPVYLSPHFHFLFRFLFDNERYQYTGMSPLGTVQSPDSFNDFFHSTPQTVMVPYTFVLSHVAGTARTYQYLTLVAFHV
jgi:hypothetical protein